MVVALGSCSRDLHVYDSYRIRFGAVFEYETHRVFRLLRRCVSSRRSRNHYRFHLREDAVNLLKVTDITGLEV